MPFASRILAVAELNLMVMFTAIADIAVRTNVATPDEILVLYCIIGGFGGSFCSLHFYQPKDRFAAGMQFTVNFCFSGIFSPLLVEYMSYWTAIPAGFRLALPVGFMIGLVACAVVARLLPHFQRGLDKWAEDAADHIPRIPWDHNKKD